MTEEKKMLLPCKKNVKCLGVNQARGVEIE